MVGKILNAQTTNTFTFWVNLNAQNVLEIRSKKQQVFFFFF